MKVESIKEKKKTHKALRYSIRLQVSQESRTDRKKEKMHKKLLIPGPTEVSQTILQEQTHPLIGHRSKEFSELYAGITGKICQVL